MIVCLVYIEAHFHPWVLQNPVNLVEGFLPLGTITIVAENLFFFMQMGLERFAAKALGKIVDGHAGGASEARLQPVAAAGIDTDHARGARGPGGRVDPPCPRLRVRGGP